MVHDGSGQLNVPRSQLRRLQPDSDETNLHIDVQDDHYQLVRTLGSASAVLLKNERGVLPLGKKDRSIVLIEAVRDLVWRARMSSLTRCVSFGL